MSAFRGLAKVREGRFIVLGYAKPIRVHVPQLGGCIHVTLLRGPGEVVQCLRRARGPGAVRRHPQGHMASQRKDLEYLSVVSLHAVDSPLQQLAHRRLCGHVPHVRRVLIELDQLGSTSSEASLICSTPEKAPGKALAKLVLSRRDCEPTIAISHTGRTAVSSVTCKLGILDYFAGYRMIVQDSGLTGLGYAKAIQVPKAECQLSLAAPRGRREVQVQEGLADMILLRVRASEG
eukprot:scaffold1312_cov393-Prasinococcus_capsulatus_cf.AAC.6